VTRRSSAAQRCPRCHIHLRHCFCAHLRPLRVATTVSLVVHVRELKLTSNTAAMLREMLPENAHLDVRGAVAEVFDAAPILARPGRPLFVYPSDDALELNADFRAAQPGPYHLIVPDGSWNQARKVHHREPRFAALPTVKLPAGLVGEYGLRRAQHPAFVSTYEAVAHALGILEDPAVAEALMAFFRVFVKSVLHSRTNFYGELDLTG